MIPGFSGRLVAQSYVEQVLLPAILNSGDASAVGPFSREVTRWWRHVMRALGPASSVRAIADVAAAPLLDALGHRHGAAGFLLSILPWGASLQSHWRDAIRTGSAAGVRWALVSNGRALRIVDCTRAWAQQAIEFHFEDLLRDPRGVAVLWALARAEALGPDHSRWSLPAIVAESDRFSAGVCQSLGDGVIEALPSLAAALGAERGQALTVVYRVLFFLFAEARGLVPVWHEVYREAYTIDALCRRIDAGPDATGLWAALQAISRLAHGGCRAGDLEVTAFNGRLFAPWHAPLTERRRVPDAVVRRMITALATTETRGCRHRIAYHDLGVEQLGSVYERVLESPERKSTGSFYTPRPITEFLVRRTLHPLVDGRSAGEILRLRVVDPAMGSGAFLVAACHYLADQCERARIRDGEWIASEITPVDRATLRRQVAERCLYGVDLNPMAVQLARLSLWLTTLAANRPLTFLDHHLATGDSLVGARLADLTRPITTRRARPADRLAPMLPIFDEAMTAVVSSQVLPVRLQLALEASDTAAIVRDKERRLAALEDAEGPFKSWHQAADVWTALHLWQDERPSAALGAELVSHALGEPSTLPASQLAPALARARALARDHSAFHWELSFPEVFFDAGGRPRTDAGFDAVIGNPPWQMPRSDAYIGFIRGSGVYASQGGGHPNRYQWFVERAWQLTRPGGRFGLIVPSGLGADHGSAALRRHLFHRCSVDTWLGFENRDAIFPIHRSVRFTIVCATNSGSTERLNIKCGMRQGSDLDRFATVAAEDPAGSTIPIARARLEAWDPEGASIPEIASTADLAILARVADRVPVLPDPSGWGARFGRELNATDDRRHFTAKNGVDRSALAIVEGKHLAPFRVEPDRSAQQIDRAVAASLIDPASSYGRARIAYRDVASATNRLTLIAALLPEDTLSTHTVFCLKTPLCERDQWCLLAILNSLVANYLVRMRVTTHVTTAIMARLPAPRPEAETAEFKELVILARRLATSGIEDGPADYARLNAIAAGLYGLSADEYAHVLTTFPLLSQQLRESCLRSSQMHTRKHGSTETRTNQSC